MISAKRIYLYSVLGVTLIPLLWGLTDLLHVALRGLASTIGAREMVGAGIVADQISWALALVVVALPIWAFHLGLVRRTLQGSPGLVADERASPIRATYFFLVLVASGAVACLSAYELAQQLIGAAVAEQRAWGATGAAAALIVVGSSWLLHVCWRRADFLAVPERTAGDWLTRAYLYGGLFVVAVAATFWFGNILSVVARELAGLSAPAWDVEARWPMAIVSPLAGAIAASAAWLIQWVLAGRFVRADPPLGEAHRASRTRSGAFLAVVLVAAIASFALISQGLEHVIAEIFGVWRSTGGSGLAVDAGGPLLMSLPFLGAWWWHQRRASGEALAFGGLARWQSVRRCGRLLVAFVGLVGLTIGLAGALSALLEYVAPADGSLPIEATLRDVAAPALAAALVGSAMWMPDWVLLQRERSHDALEVSVSTSRRLYLLLVSALAVMALMGSLAYLVYQAARMLVEAGPPADVGLAGGVFAVAGVVLAYHALLLRADALLVAASQPFELGPSADVETSAGRVVETIEISAPAGSDLAALNAAIRRQLPSDYELRVLT